MSDVENPSNDSEYEEILLLLLLLRRRRRRVLASSRKLWIRRWIQRRQDQGAFSNLVRELNAEDPEKFRQYHRLDRESFEEILSLVSPVILKQDTVMRTSVTPSERLAVTLRFLATGESFRSLSFQYRLGDRTISGIIDETCQALYSVLRETHLKTPTSIQEWQKVAEEFEVKWNYPCCIGSLDGKHIAIKQPDCSGSDYFNYKHFFSVLLLALVDANYKFIYVSAGACGRAGDAGVYTDSTLKSALDDGTLNLPPPKSLEGVNESKIDYHIIGDDAFSLTKTLMKPYPHRNMDKKMRIFNYRLSRSRRVFENAFGILANRFRVFLSTINLSPDKVRNLILTACCLHNYLGEKNKHSYLGACDLEDEKSHTFTNGRWRSDPHLIGLVPSTDRNPTKSAKEQRQLLTNYFSDKGTVSWQDQMI